MAPNIEISVPPWAVLGYRADGRPIYPIAGGAEEGGDPAPDPDPEPDGNDQDGNEPNPDAWTPPTREEWEAHQEKLRKASGEAAARRKFLREHGIDPKTGNKLQPDPDPEPDPEPRSKDNDEPRGPSAAEVRRQVEKAAAEAELRGMRKTKALVTGLNGALADAGWNGSRLASLMKLLDLDDVDVDDEGEITGLSEQIAEIKSEWPEFFKRQRSTSAGSAASSGQNGAPAAKVDTADKPAPKPEPKNWAEQLAAKALRG